MIRKHRNDLEIKSVYIKNLEDATQKMYETITMNLTSWPSYLFQELRPHFQSPYLQPPPIQHSPYYVDQGELENFTHEEEFLHDTTNLVGVDQQEEIAPVQEEDELNTEEERNVEPQTQESDKTFDID